MGGCIKCSSQQQLTQRRSTATENVCKLGRQGQGTTNSHIIDAVALHVMPLFLASWWHAFQNHALGWHYAADVLFSV